jgi:hypothetical protein
MAGEFRTARAGLALSIDQVARPARVAPSTVKRVLDGDGGVHLDTLCAIADAIGLSLSVKVFPGPQPSLRDSGQLAIARHLIERCAPSYRTAIEVPVGDPYGRAADLVLFGPDEIVHVEIERHIADLQAMLRAVSVKRDALQARHARPVRLVIAIEDTRRNRTMMAPHRTVIASALPVGSGAVARAIRLGTVLGRDGIWWVRPPARVRADESAGRYRT